LAAVIVGFHPARQQLLFWSSAAADAICLALSIVCLGLVLRACRRPSLSWSHCLAMATASALAALSKEIGLALPLLALAVSCALPWKRQLALTAASAAGAAVALVAALSVLGGGGQPRAILSAAGGLDFLTYPVRLLWPGDQESWFYRAEVHGDFFPIATVGLVIAAVVTLLVVAWRGRYLSAWAGTGLLLVALGLLPWLVRHEDRGIGLGVVGIAILIAGAALPREGASPLRAAVVLLAIAAAWSPLWLRWEARWIEASRLSEAVATSGRNWREEAGAGRLLVALGAPSRTGWHGEVAGLQEIDRCVVDLLGQVGSTLLAPIEVVPQENGSRLRITAGGDAVLRWGGSPEPGFGIMEVIVDHTGRTRGAVFDPRPLVDLAARRGCSGVNVRVWDGERFSEP
jgi:hypothetical protein